MTRPRRPADGGELFADGDPGTHFFVLVEGELVVSKVVDGRDEVPTRHSALPQPTGGHDGTRRRAPLHRLAASDPEASGREAPGALCDPALTKCWA